MEQMFGTNEAKKKIAEILINARFCCCNLFPMMLS